MKNSSSALLLGLALAAGWAVPVSRADAALLNSNNGSGVCRAADGQDFNLYYSTFNVKNISDSPQLLSCNMPLLRESLANFILLPTGYELGVYFANQSAVTQTVTCTATVGPGGPNSASIRTVSTKQIVLSPAMRAGALHWDRSELPIKDNVQPLGFDCSLPPGVFMGAVHQFQPELTQAGL